MREMCVIVVALFVSLGGSSPAAQQDASPTDTEVAQKLWRIAATSHVRVGFQSIGIPGHRRLNENIDPEPMAVSRALDAVVAADPRYEWHMVAGTAVIRPREAWTDPADPLNHRVPTVQITNEPMNGVLVGLSNLIFYNQFTLEPGAVAMRETLVSFPMKAGTIIDALNQLAEQAGQIMWVAYARPRDNPDGWNVCQTPGSCHSALRFDLRGAEHMTGFVSTQPWAKKGNP
jgi:hypothetical protein